jgi:hypothetical protein
MDDGGGGVLDNVKVEDNDDKPRGGGPLLIDNKDGQVGEAMGVDDDGMGWGVTRVKFGNYYFTCSLRPFLAVIVYAYVRAPPYAYLFIGTRNFHYCENYEPQKTVFFLLFVLSPYVSTFVECTINSRSMLLS